MIRACRRFAAFAGVATLPRQFEISARASESAKTDSVVDYALLSTAAVRTSIVEPRARWRCCGRCANVTNPEGKVEWLDALNGSLPRTHRRGRCRKSTFTRRALHRAGRLPRGAAAEVLPTFARQRSAASLRLHLLKCEDVIKDEQGRIVGAAVHHRSQHVGERTLRTAAK